MPFLVALEVKPAPKYGGGAGLFALDAIPKGTKLWVCRAQGNDVDKVVTPKLNIENPPVLGANRVWTENEMQDLPSQEIERIFWGGYAHEPSETWIELRDGANFTNHSDHPNCGSEFVPEPLDEEHFAIKDIAVGEELVDDYGGFHNEKVTWINKMMKERCPGRHDFERDFATVKAKAMPEVAGIDISK